MAGDVDFRAESNLRLRIRKEALRGLSRDAWIAMGMAWQEMSRVPHEPVEDAATYMKVPQH